MSEITDITMSLSSPGLALLNLETDKLSPPKRHTVMHILFAARLSIPRHWKSSRIPLILEIIDQVQTHCSYELMLASSNSRFAQTALLWQPWTQWFKGICTNEPLVTLYIFLLEYSGPCLDMWCSLTTYPTIGYYNPFFFYLVLSLLSEFTTSAWLKHISFFSSSNGNWDGCSIHLFKLLSFIACF